MPLGASFFYCTASQANLFQVCTRKSLALCSELICTSRTHRQGHAFGHIPHKHDAVWTARFHRQTAVQIVFTPITWSSVTMAAHYKHNSHNNCWQTCFWTFVSSRKRAVLNELHNSLQVWQKLGLQNIIYDLIPHRDWFWILNQFHFLY